MKFKLALAAGLAAVAAAGAAAAGPASTTANASANIVAPVQLTSTRDLDFGTIARPTNGTTTVTVASAASATATPTVSGGNGYIPTAGLAKAAIFHLVGASNEAYTISTNALSFTSAAGNLANIGSEAPVAASGTLNTLPASGVDDLYIGGHFDISSTTALQTYTGTLSLTVNFN